MRMDGDRGGTGAVPERSHEARREMTSTADGPPGRRADPRTWAESFLGHATPVLGPATCHRTQSDAATKLAFPQAAISFPEREEEAPCLDLAERALPR